MYIASREIIKKIIDKWNITKEYLPSTIQIYLKNKDLKIVNLIVDISTSVFSDSNDEDDNKFLEKVIKFINDPDSAINSEGLLIVNDDEIKSIELYVYSVKDYYSSSILSVFGEYKWPINIDKKSNS